MAQANGGPLPPNGQLKWQWLLEWVVIPCFGMLIVALAIAGVPVPAWVVPLASGAIFFPLARQLDRWRKGE